MSTDGPTEKIPTTTAAGTTPGPVTPDPTAPGPTQTSGASPEATTAAFPAASTDPLSEFDEPAVGSPAAAPAPSAVPAPAAATSPAPESDAPVRRGVRVGTFVWGLVIVAVGIGVFALSAGYTLDVELALIILLGAAGAAMLVGSLLKGRRGGSR